MDVYVQFCMCKFVYCGCDYFEYKHVLQDLTGCTNFAQNLETEERSEEEKS